MSPIDLETYLHKHIPLSKAMHVSVTSIREDEVLLGAPLAPNINHRETAFGGSASALAILAAWSLLHVRLRAARLPNRLVIQRNTMNYDAPIEGAFTARSYFGNAATWERFARTFTRKGKARIAVAAVLEYAGRTAGRFEGEFVALNTEQTGVVAG